jgi:ribosomal protein S18 acetylase RimI-like enzyme
MTTPSALRDLPPRASPMDDQLRRATPADIGALSRLLVQLYAVALPGMLRGEIEVQVELASRLLRSAPLGRRYVLERAGEVVGMGSLATHDEPRPETPARVLLQAPVVMGPLNGAFTILGAARGLLTIADPPEHDEGQIHSVVVDETCRGQGLGGVILGHLETDAVSLGKRRAVLQVITSNVGARGFYRSAGYSEAELRRGLPRDRIAYPSVLMRKELTTPSVDPLARGGGAEAPPPR